MHATSPASEHLHKGDDLFQQREYLAARAEFMTAYDSARSEFNRSVEVEALSQIARTHIALGELDDAQRRLAEVEQIARDTDAMGWSRYLGVVGRLEWKENRLDAARLTFTTLFEYASLHTLSGRAVDAANMLAIVASTLDDQLAWVMRGIEIAETNGEESWLAPLWNNLGGIRFEQTKYQDALKAYLKAREYHWQHSPETAKLFADYHVGMVYRYMGEYELAGQWLRPVVAWAERLGHHNALGQAHEELGEIAAARGNYAEARKELEASRAAYEAAGFATSSPDTIARITNRLADLANHGMMR